jgi:hypothetical protein
MKQATVQLTKEGAMALKAHMVGRYGSAGIQHGHGSLLAAKEAAQEKPVSEYETVECFLPEWDGDLKERAAVGLGLRKKSARFIVAVTVHD